jgi:reactive chlorine resistance protein C
MFIGQSWETHLKSIGGAVLRYSLVFFFLAFGLYKFTPQEAAGVEPLMAHSPVLFWVDPLLGVRGGGPPSSAVLKSHLEY